MELLFVLFALLLLDIGAVLFGADSREHMVDGGSAHALG